MPFLPPKKGDEDISTSYQTYLPSVFYLWKVVTDSLPHDIAAIKLAADITNDSIFSELVTMNEYGIFTKEQMLFMFTNFLRVMDISVSQGGSPYTNWEYENSRHQSEKSKVTYDISRIIVFSMAGDESLKPGGVLELLENLINSIETFYHPSNNGGWSHSITMLLDHLAHHMVFRWNTERSGEFKVAKERQITDAVKDRFVTALRDVALMSLHSKSNTAVNCALGCIQNLAFLSPDLVLPFILKEVYPSLQGVVETHRTMSSLKALSHLTRIITQTPRYAIHLSTLLTLAIPGIDANDLNKTFQALTFIQAAALNAPFWDLSEEIGGGLVMEYVSNDVAYLEQLAIVNPLTMTDAQKEGEEEEFKKTVTCLPDYEPELLEQIWKSSTGLFREFIIEFIERIFTLIENLPDPSSSKHRASQESNVIMLLSPTFSAVMSALPKDLHEVVVTRFLDFISNNVYYSATDAIALICSTIVRDDPSGVFPRIFPILKTSIETEILENGAGSIRSGSEILPRDRTLIWYISILNMSLFNANEELLKFKKEILDLTIFMRDNTRGSTVFHVSNTVHHALISLSMTMIKDCGIITDRFSKVPGKDVTLKNWGEKIKPRELKFDWYTISREGAEYCYELYKAHVEKSLSNISEVISSKSKLSESPTEISDILFSNITYIRTATSGLALLLDPHYRDYYKDDFEFNESSPLSSLTITSLFNKDDSSGEDDNVDVDGDAEEAEESYAESWEESDGDGNVPITEPPPEDDGEADFDDDGLDFKKLREYPTGYFFDDNKSDPLYINIHKLHIKVAHALHEIHSFMTVNRESDIATFKALLFAYKVWFADVGIERTAKLGESFTNVYNFESEKYRVDGLHKEFPRSILSKRAVLYYYARIYHNCGPKKITDLDKVLINDVLITSVSIYPDICRTAQSSLESAVKGLLKSRSHIVNWIVSDIINSLDKNELQRAESGMGVLALRILQSHIKKAFLNSTKFLTIIVKALKADKPTLNKLSGSLLQTFEQSMNIAVTINLLNQDALEELKPEKDVSQEIEKRKIRQEAKYKAIVGKLPETENVLLEYLSEPHWKILLFVLRFLMEYVSISDPKFQAHPQILIKLNELCLNSHPHVRQLAGACLQCSFTRTFRLAANKYEFKLLIDYEDLGINKEKISTQSPDFTKKFMDEYSNLSSPSFYIDGYKPGWMVWHKDIVVQKPVYTQDVILSETDQKVFSELGERLDSEWLKKIIIQLSEEMSSHEDTFHLPIVHFLLSIFRLIEMNITKLTLDETIDILRSSFDGTDKNSHRCLAEFLAAMMFSTEHSSQESRKKKLDFTFEMFKHVIINHLFRDSLSYWKELVTTTFMLLDHRRFKDLYEFIINHRLDKSSSSVFKEQANIFLFEEVVFALGWASPTPSAIVDHYWSKIDYPKKSVSAEIGHLLGEFYFEQFHPSYPSVDVFIEEQLKFKDGLGARIYDISPTQDKLIREGFVLMESQRLAESKTLPKTKSSTDVTNGEEEEDSGDYVHTATTLVQFMICVSTWSCGIAVIPLLPEVILPASLRFFTLSEEPDLGKNAVAMFRGLGNLPCPPYHLQFLIDSSVKVLKAATHWHQRIAMLSYFQTFFFRQLFQMSSHQRQQFVMAAAETLEDSQLEVREAAAETLAGMIRCSPVKEQAELINRLQRQFRQSLISHKIVRRPGIPRNAEERRLMSGTSTPTSEVQTVSIKRHAAVLGLGALVTAFPYKSPPPKWIPQILTTLASVASEPGMTGKSVKSLLGSFKNTRTDTWHIDSKVFTSEQLEDLEGVLWKSYFV